MHLDCSKTCSMVKVADIGEIITVVQNEMLK